MTSPFVHPNPGGPRSPERIWSVLADVGEYWRANPDMRLTQVILNATKSLGVDVDKAYNVEDAPLVGALRTMLEAQPPASLTCHRLVPLGHAAYPSVLMASSSFGAWFDQHRPGIGRLSDCTVLTVDLAESVIDDRDTPVDDATATWTAAVREAVALTKDDSWRPYDSVVVPTTHRVHTDLTRLSDEVARVSTLLAPVAEGIDMLLHTLPGNTIGSYHDLVADGIGEDVFGDTDVRWAHIEVLVPNLRERLVAIVGGLLAEIPAPAEDDDFAARTPETRPL